MSPIRPREGICGEFSHAGRPGSLTSIRDRDGPDAATRFETSERASAGHLLAPAIRSIPQS